MEPTQQQIDRIVEMVRKRGHPTDVLAKLLWVLDLPELPDEGVVIVARAMTEIVGMRVILNRTAGAALDVEKISPPGEQK